MNISISAAGFAGTASSMADGQLATLASLATQMVAIRRDTQLPEEMKKVQLALLREQTHAIQQSAVDRIENKTKSALVDSSSASADVAARDARTSQGGIAAGNANGTAGAPSEPVPITEPASRNAAGESGIGTPSLGTVVDTYA